MKSAQAAGIYLVSLNWLLESIEADIVLAEKNYIFDAAAAPAAPAAPAPSGPSSSQASATAAPRVGTRISKRTASNLKDMVIDSDEKKDNPPAKKTRSTAKGKAVDKDKDADKMDIDGEEEEEKPAPKKTKAAAKGKKVKDEEKDADAKLVTAQTKGKGKGKGKAAPKSEDEQEEEEEEEEVKPNMKTVIKKGKAPVDELCPGAGRHPVLHPQDLIYSY